MLREVEPVTVEESTTEGLMLADYANRMRVKNAIIVGVLSGGGSYDPERYVVDATAALGGLADEFEQAAKHLAEQITLIDTVPGAATHAHDYRVRDRKNLRHREEVLHGLIAELRRRSEDRGHLLDLVESARVDAWADIARAVTDALDRSFLQVDANYDRDRDQRMRLVTADLRNLLADLET